MVIWAREEEVYKNLQERKRYLEKWKQIDGMDAKKKAWLEEGILLCELSCQVLKNYQDTEEKNKEIIQAVLWKESE